MKYSIQNGRLTNADSRYVAENRETALAFATDVANGLLDAITDTLEKRKTEAEGALGVIEAALRKPLVGASAAGCSPSAVCVCDSARASMHSMYFLDAALSLGMALSLVALTALAKPSMKMATPPKSPLSYSDNQ